MFLQEQDLEEEDLDVGDAVVPVSLSLSQPPGRGVDRPACEGGEGGSTRSAQYQERLNRARQQKTQALQRRSMNSGMVVSNVAPDLPPQRPGAAQGRSGAGQPTIDVLNQEVEEMELEENNQAQKAQTLHQQLQRSSPVESQQQQAYPAASSSQVQQPRSQKQAEQPRPRDQQQQGELAPPQEQQQPQLAPARSISHTPAQIDTSDLRAFLMRPGPEGAMVQCYIQRRKSGMARLFPTYEIYLKDGDQFLLAARKRKKNKSSNYLISLDKDDLARQSGNFFGKLRSNFLGTEFSLYDKGVNPDKLEHMSRETVQLRQELGTILYKQNVLGSRGPRKMKVMVPNVNEAGQRKILRPQSAEETMLERYKAAKNDDDVQILKNKPPKWNEQVGAYVLNFNGRVTRASVKNFQLYNPAKDPEAVIMQFGRVGKDAFTMDYQHPLCALQAFGIALSSFDYKIACE